MNADHVVLDTSAILAFLLDEPGADEVEDQLAAAESGGVDLHPSFASVAEVFYATHKKHGPAKAEEFAAVFRGWPVEIVYPDEALTISAGRLKAAHAISFADSFIAATARQLDAELVHKDPEYEALAGIVKLAPLPYKPRKRR